MNFSLDKEVAIELAKKMGIKVSFNNEESGVFFNNKETNEVTKFNFNDFIPELEKLGDEFITKDEEVFSQEITLINQKPKFELKMANEFFSSNIQLAS